MKKIVAGNWKMNLNKTEAIAHFEAICQSERKTADVDLLVFPPACYLLSFSEKVEKASGNVFLGAQNVHYKNNGAFTGEISAEMLSAMGVKFCLVGHSERRQYFGETDADVAEKVSTLLQHKITPVICVGESLEERESGKHFEVITQQVNAALEHTNVKQLDNLIFAYEPVWAIGTGKTATAEQAEEVHAHVRKVLVKDYGEKAAQIPILYGGSCNASNAEGLFSQPNINGGLIGGASLKLDDFLSISESF